MKTYAPKGLHGADLRPLIDDLVATPGEVAKFLHVTERSVWRWLAEGSAPWPVLALLWHETPRGRESASCDVGNDLVIQRTQVKASGAALASMAARMARLVRIGDFGSANDPLVSGPASTRPMVDGGAWVSPITTVQQPIYLVPNDHAKSPQVKA